MSLDGSKYKITTVKMVYATQVINSGEDDYPSPSQFEQWKLDSQKQNLKLPTSEKSRRTKDVPECSSRNGRINQSGLIPVRNYLQSMEMVSETPEREIIDERTMRCQSEQPKSPSSRTSGNVVRSNSDRPQVCDKPNVSRSDSVEPNLIKSSTTSLASIASDIVVVSAGWFSSLRRPGKKRRKQEIQNSKAKSAWDLSNLGKMVCFNCFFIFFYLSLLFSIVLSRPEMNALVLFEIISDDTTGGNASLVELFLN